MTKKKTEKRYKVLGRVRLPLVEGTSNSVLQHVTLYNGISIDAAPPQESDYVYLTKAEIEAARHRYQVGLSNLIKIIAESMAREFIEEQTAEAPMPRKLAPKVRPAEPDTKRGERGRKAGAPRKGSVVVWPKGVEERYGISAVTRWRWEKAGRLPKRDVEVGGRTGWRPNTLDAAEAAHG